MGLTTGQIWPFITIFSSEFTPLPTLVLNVCLVSFEPGMYMWSGGLHSLSVSEHNVRNDTSVVVFSVTDAHLESRVQALHVHCVCVC